MQPITAMVFDFDGTLAHLTIDFSLMRRRVAALAEAFLGQPPETVDLPVLEWLDELAADLEERQGRDTALEFHCRGRLVVNATELDAAREGGLFPFTRELLAELRNRGVGVGIVTRNSTAAVRTVFPDVGQWCGAFLAREDARALKPDPGHVLQALEMLGQPPERALMVGDHGMDLVAGQKAGCRTAGVCSGNMTRAALHDFAPDYLEEDVQALLRVLLDEKALPGA